MEIDDILKQAEKIVRSELKGSSYKLFLFGSRAMAKHDKRSDIDIGILPDQTISAKKLLTIQEKLEQIPTLLKIDLVDFTLVDDEFKKIALKHAQDITS